MTVLIYGSYFGIPLCAVLVLIFDLVLEKRYYGLRSSSEEISLRGSCLLWQVFYLIVASILMILSAFANVLSFKYEDASKVTIVLSTDLIFGYLFQYELLGVVSEWMAVLGAVLIVLGTIFIALYRIFDSGQKPTSCFVRFLCFKF